MRSKGIRSRMLAGALAMALALTTAFVVPPAQARAAEEPSATNISFDTARELKFGTAIGENMEGSDNKRYYKFSLSEACVLSIKHEMRVAYQHPAYFRIYDGTRTKVCEYTRTSGYINGEDANGTISEIYLTGGAYYLEVEFDLGNINLLVTADTLSESFTETQTANNNSISSASPIALDTSYKGVLAWNDDKDYYAFTIPVDGMVNLNLTNSAGNKIKYTIYDSSSYSVDVGEAAKDSKLEKEISLSSDTYYLAVAKSEDNSIGSFILTLYYTMGVPKITAVTNPDLGKMTVKWDTVGGAEGYELQYSKSATFASGVTTKTLSSSASNIVLTGLTSGTYYVRMRVCATLNGQKKYGGWSVKESASVVGTIKAPTLSSVKNNASKGMLVKWKGRSDVEGYELQYSLKKNFKSNTKKKKLSVGNNSVKISGLKKGKTYYVRLRCYVTLNGKTKYSDWSKVKNVKIKK